VIKGKVSSIDEHNPVPSSVVAPFISRLWFVSSIDLKCFDQLIAVLSLDNVIPNIVVLLGSAEINIGFDLTNISSLTIGIDNFSLLSIS